jgi:LacI family transcriptional regulator
MGSSNPDDAKSAIPSLRMIAQKAGVSRTTVGEALRPGSTAVSPELRERIRQIAVEVGYQKNPVLSELMAHLRRNQVHSFRGKLALLNANADRDALRRHPTIPTYVTGAERRAATLGYSFDQFWLHDPALDAAAWSRIFSTRALKGILIVGLMDQVALPSHLQSLWKEFPTVVTGVRTRNPVLSFSAVDHHALVMGAFERALELGYTRPALVLDPTIDDLVEGRFTAGMLMSQTKIPAKQRLPIFGDMDAARKNPAVFARWLKQHKPDVILTLYNVVFDWLAAAKWRVPQDVGVIQLEWRASRPEVAGMNQHNDIVGEAAVDMLIHKIYHHEFFDESFPRATLIGATWMEGTSVRPQKAARAAKTRARQPVVAR